MPTCPKCETPADCPGDYRCVYAPKDFAFLEGLSQQVDITYIYRSEDPPLPITHVKLFVQAGIGKLPRTDHDG
jgi:hypothetical protein